MATLYFPTVTSEGVIYLPLDFQLVNSDGNPIIWATENPTDADCLLFTLTNQGIIQRIPLDIDLSTQSHFELSFRKGTLSAKTIQLLKPGAGWHPLNELWKISVTETSEGIDILFRGSLGTGRWLWRGESIKLTLSQFSAAASGDRLTQVLFTPTDIPLYWSGKRLYGWRHQQLAVLRRPQDSQIPFSVALVDTQPIVNDGRTRNTLHLRITNQMAQSLQLTPRGNALPTTLTLTFNISETTEQFALTDSLNAGKIISETVGWSKWHVADPTSKQGRAPEFAFTTDATVMNPNETFEIILSEIVSKTVSNQANLTISYENLPDPKYANGEIVVTVQKTSS